MPAYKDLEDSYYRYKKPSYYARDYPKVPKSSINIYELAKPAEPGSDSKELGKE